MRVEFQSDEFKLAALIDAPRDGSPKAFAIFAPCFTCNKNIKTAAYISRALAERGIAVLRFDFRGLGESEGQFADATLTTNIHDILSAGKYLAEHHSAPALLIGHSFGGPAAIRAAPQIPACRAVVTINSPSDPRHVTTYFEDKLPQIHSEGVASVDIVGRPFPISRKFILDLENQNHPEAIANLGKPLLICHSAADEIVPISEALEIFAAARHPKSFLSLDSDHYLFERKDAEYAADIIAAWASRYLS